jgi:hypothetical protein
VEFPLVCHTVCVCRHWEYLGTCMLTGSTLFVCGGWEGGGGWRETKACTLRLYSGRLGSLTVDRSEHLDGCFACGRECVVLLGYEAEGFS